MTSLSGDLAHGAFVVLLLLGCVLAAAAWVHSDARAHARRGRPVVSEIGSLELRTPVSWFLACLVLPEMVLPAYVESRPTA
jgi:hypothetical protein